MILMRAELFPLPGHSPADYTLLSVQVMIRHGDRYPLYSIPKTKRPTIDCTLSPNRCAQSSPSRYIDNNFINPPEGKLLCPNSPAVVEQ